MDDDSDDKDGDELTKLQSKVDQKRLIRMRLTK